MRLSTTLLGVALLGASGCEDSFPTAVDDDRIPVEVQTVEVRLPFSSFARDLRAYGGFGNAGEIGRGYLASDFAGVLNANTLIRFGAYPAAVTVRDTLGVSRSDSSLVFPRGELIVRFDTLPAFAAAGMTVSAGATLSPWHAGSATWELAVDTLGERTEWPEPGAGPVRFIDSGAWDPAEADSLVLEVDSATVAEWGDRDEPARGLRLSLESGDTRARVRSATLRLDTRPSVRPDTIVHLNVATERLTFVYDPVPQPEDDELTVGGVPARRTVFDMELPETLDGPPELCAVIECPHALTPESIVFAALVLQGATTPEAFRPVDPFFLDVRPVLSPQRLPRSPLGGSLLQAPRELTAEFFEDDGEPDLISIPMTGYVRSLLTGTTPQGTPVPRTLALISAFEPSPLDFATFAAPGTDGEPYLRIIFTLTDGVRLP